MPLPDWEDLSVERQLALKSSSHCTMTHYLPVWPPWPHLHSPADVNSPLYGNVPPQMGLAHTYHFWQKQICWCVGVNSLGFGVICGTVCPEMSESLLSTSVPHHPLALSTAMPHSVEEPKVVQSWTLREPKTISFRQSDAVLSANVIAFVFAVALLVMCCWRKRSRLVAITARAHQ